MSYVWPQCRYCTQKAAAMSQRTCGRPRRLSPPGVTPMQLQPQYRAAIPNSFLVARITHTMDRPETRFAIHCLSNPHIVASGASIGTRRSRCRCDGNIVPTSRIDSKTPGIRSHRCEGVARATLTLLLGLTGNSCRHERPCVISIWRSRCLCSNQ